MSRRASVASSRALKIAAKKIKEPDEEGVLQIDGPVKYVGQAWEVKHTQVPEMKLPSMDTSPLSAYRDLRMAEKRLESTENGLLRKRKARIKRMALLNAQWSNLESKEEALKDNFKAFNKFLRENLEKRERAQKKLCYDEELIKNRQAEIDYLKKKYDEWKSHYLLMRRQIEKHSIYMQYLDRVVQASNGEFKDIVEPLQRMDILFVTRRELQARQILELEILESSKIRMTKFLECGVLQGMGFNNTLAHLRKKFDNCISQSLEFGNLVVNIKVTISNLMSELITNKNTIENIYDQICMRKKIIEKYRKKNHCKQLLMIGHTIKGFREAHAILANRDKKKKSGRGRKKKS